MFLIHKYIYNNYGFNDKIAMTSLNKNGLVTVNLYSGMVIHESIEYILYSMKGRLND